MIREKMYITLLLLLFIPFSPGRAQSTNDGAEFFRQAQEARQEQRFDDAHAALDRAAELEFSPLRVRFERARVYTLAGATGKAVAEIEKIAAAGFTAVGFITNDAILKTLAGDAAYDAVVEKMSARAYPCAVSDEFRAFDFWVGDWDVRLADGSLAGSNTIERAERGCVLIENWTSASGGTGMSVNYLDKITGEWVQVWNAEGGSQIHIRGGMTDEGMLLVGTLHTVGTGSTVPFRGLWTLLEDGRVRQFFEQSLDDGETWTPWFEGFYSRKE